MSILLNNRTRLLIQGLGNEGQNQIRRSLDYGTRVVAGVHPGFRGGETFTHGNHSFPVFATVTDAVEKTQANCSIIYVPAPGAADSILENIAAEVPLIVCITEGVPVHDMIRVRNTLALKNEERKKTNLPPLSLIGPNCPGIIQPASQCRVGIHPPDVFMPGNVGVVSRSGTLVYEAVDQLTRAGIGQSTCVGVGGDPIIGEQQQAILRRFNSDPDTDAVVLIGEIGGLAEQAAAAYIKRSMTKPVVAFIAGATAPPGRRMGHAGAIIEGEAGTAEAKLSALEAAGAVISRSPAEIGSTMRRVLEEAGKYQSPGAAE